MREFNVVFLGMAVVFSIGTVAAFAGDKPVQLETIPAGAQVEVNGSVTCTTPPPGALTSSSQAASPFGPCC